MKMKREILLFSMVSMVVSGSAYAQYQIFLNDKLYDDRYGKPENFTGVMTIKRDGKLEERYQTVKNQKHGLYEKWDREERPSEKGNFTEGKRQGRWYFWGQNSSYPGKLSAIRHYVDGNTVGIQEAYQDGKLERLYYVKPNGSVDTDLSWHFSNGKLKSIKCGEFSVNKQDRAWCGMTGKVGVVQLYRENGTLDRVERYLKGKLHGRLQKYNSEGKLVSYSTYEQGDILKGPALGTSTSGGKWEVQCAKNNLKRCREIAYFKDLPTQKEVLIVWDVNDKVSQTEYFQNGKVKYTMETKGKGKVHAKHYYDNGNLEREGQYVNKTESYWGRFWQRMVPDGPIKNYLENGNMRSEESYVEGKEHGVFKIYCYDSKIVCKQKEYENGRLKSLREYDSTTGKLNKSEEYFPDGSRKVITP